MKQGKPSENVLMRSVLREIGTYRKEAKQGAGIGIDCAFFEWKNKSIAMTTQTVALPIRNAGKLCVLAADNNLASQGVQTVGVLLGITMPERYEESWLKQMMREINDCCKERSIQILGGDTQSSPYLSVPVITVTAVGEGSCQQEHRHPDQKYDLVVSKYIGIEGTMILYQNKKEELLKRYPEHFLRGVEEFEDHLSIREEAAIAWQSNVYAVHDIRSGGIFGALWELSRRLDTGLQVDIKKIPILQETIEICEFFEINPYQMMSGGALLMLAENGEQLAATLADAGIPASVIGTTTTGNDKILYNGEEIRFLDKAAQDEIYKLPWSEFQ